MQPAVDPVDDNPFRRPPSTSAAAVPPPVPTGPAVAADAVSGTGMPSSVQPCGCDRLAEANATASRTVNVGTDILVTLGAQREQLINAGSTLADQRSDLQRAGTLVTTMLRRAATNKLVLKLIIALLITIIIVILIAKFAPRHHHH